MTKQTPLIFHENYGDVTRAQLAAYRKFNVSPSDHDDLCDALGGGNHDAIVKAVKHFAEKSGYYNPGWGDLDSYARSLVG